MGSEVRNSGRGWPKQESNQRHVEAHSIWDWPVTEPTVKQEHICRDLKTKRLMVGTPPPLITECERMFRSGTMLCSYLDVQTSRNLLGSLRGVLQSCWAPWVDAQASHPVVQEPRNHSPWMVPSSASVRCWKTGVWK